MWLQKLTPDTAQVVKKYGYLIFLLPLTLPLSSFLLAQATGFHDEFAFFTIFVVFVLVPIVDILLGKDPVNPDEAAVISMSQERFYYWLTLSCLPLYALCIIYSSYLLMNWPELSLIGQIGYVMSLGVVGGIIAINVGHELIHKSTKLEQVSGGLLLSLVSYAGFKVEHIYGHHVHVSTPRDASSAQYNQSLYPFLANAYIHNFLNAWQLQKQRLSKKGNAFLSLNNELILYYGFSLCCSLLLGALFEWLGHSFVVGVAVFFAQSAIAFTLLEVINYIEHYGLRRRELDHGQYERVTPEHSWNSNYFLTNMFLFQLQRHSDHHAYAARRYQVLRHHENSPQLPFGYATMFVIALLPPLWKHIMNPKVQAYYEDDYHVIQRR